MGWTSCGSTKRRRCRADSDANRGAGHAHIPGQEPWKDGALPAPARLRHAIDRLLHAAKALDAVALRGWNHVHDTVGQRRGVTGGWRAIHDLTGEEIALEIRSDEVPAMHLQAQACADGAEDAEGGGSHSGAECLVVIDAGHLGAPLDAESGFLAAVALDLVRPRQLDDAAAARKSAPVDVRPGPVLLVVQYLRKFGVQPADRVQLHGVAMVGRIVGPALRQGDVPTAASVDGAQTAMKPFLCRDVTAPGPRWRRRWSAVL